MLFFYNFHDVRILSLYFQSFLSLSQIIYISIEHPIIDINSNYPKICALITLLYYQSVIDQKRYFIGIYITYERLTKSK